MLQELAGHLMEIEFGAFNHPAGGAALQILHEPQHGKGRGTVGRVLILDRPGKIAVEIAPQIDRSRKPASGL